jgi:hypothetical protein
MAALLSVSKWLFLLVAFYYAVFVLCTFYGVEEWVEINGEIWTMLEIREGLMFASLIAWLLCEVYDEG